MLRLIALLACGTTLVTILMGAAPATRPAPVHTSAEARLAARGSKTPPDIDPVKFAAEPFELMPVGGTFRAFLSAAYAWSNVWLYAEDDDGVLYRRRTAYTYPEFYTPTWGELFDHVARQTQSHWEWDAKKRQFKFSCTDDEPFFGVKLADGWKRKDRGLYVWHARGDDPCGMDIYYFGHYTTSPDMPDLARLVREHFAIRSLSSAKNPPGLSAMKPATIAGAEALYLECDGDRPDTRWRQWTVLVDGHAFLIVSSFPKSRADQFVPDVDEMLKTFKVTSPAEKPEKAK